MSPASPPSLKGFPRRSPHALTLGAMLQGWAGRRSRSAADRAARHEPAVGAWMVDDVSLLSVISFYVTIQINIVKLSFSLSHSLSITIVIIITIITICCHHFSSSLALRASAAFIIWFNIRCLLNQKRDRATGESAL